MKKILVIIFILGLIPFNCFSQENIFIPDPTERLFNNFYVGEKIYPLWFENNAKSQRRGFYWQKIDQTGKKNFSDDKKISVSDVADYNNFSGRIAEKNGLTVILWQGIDNKIYQMMIKDEVNFFLEEKIIIDKPAILPNSLSNIVFDIDNNFYFAWREFDFSSMKANVYWQKVNNKGELVSVSKKINFAENENNYGQIYLNLEAKEGKNFIYLATNVINQEKKSSLFLFSSDLISAQEKNFYLGKTDSDQKILASKLINGDLFFARVLKKENKQAINYLKFNLTKELLSLDQSLDFDANDYFLTADFSFDENLYLVFSQNETLSAVKFFFTNGVVPTSIEKKIIEINPNFSIRLAGDCLRYFDKNFYLIWSQKNKKTNEQQIKWQVFSPDLDIIGTDFLVNSIIDTDADFLLDREEFYYKTDVKNRDTDKDSYLDGVEVFNNFSPTSTCKERFYEPAEKVFAYGRSRLIDLDNEKCLAKYLKNSLEEIVGLGKIGLPDSKWSMLVNAYIYGEYPIEAIIKAITVNESIINSDKQWIEWKDSKEYKVMYK